MRVVDFLVVGGGVAGLSAAAGLAGAGSVLVVTKEGLAESNTAYAQGGIAVAMGGDEDVALHLADTIAAGDGLVNERAAAGLVEQGPRRVEELLEWGTGLCRDCCGCGRGFGGRCLGGGVAGVDVAGCGAAAGWGWVAARAGAAGGD